jgi:hypothetical protein
VDVSTGGTDGNEHLTAITGAVLLVLLAVLWVSILRIHQLISVHLFVGLLLIGPVALKLASTGYRFMRYYSRDPVYREKGPPPTALRLLAPGVVATTVLVFVSGIVLMFLGPAHRQAWLLVHKASFIAWLGLTGVHVLGHLPGLAILVPRRAAGADWRPMPGSAARWLTLVGAIVGGVVLAIVLIPHFSAWTAGGAFDHPHDH